MCFFFVFSRVWQDCSSQVVFFGEVAEPSCRRRDIFGPFFHFFHLILEARSAFPRRLLIDTRPPAAFFVVFHPCRCKIQLCWSSVIGAWCPSAWRLSAVWCACGPRTAFFWLISAATGHTASNLCLGGTGVGACPSRAAVRLLGPFPPLPAACFVWFFASVSYVFSLFSWVTVCLCWVQILWEYLLANC
jgi:hypothetical protein